MSFGYSPAFIARQRFGGGFGGYGETEMITGDEMPGPGDQVIVKEAVPFWKHPNFTIICVGSVLALLIVLMGRKK